MANPAFVAAAQAALDANYAHFGVAADWNAEDGSASYSNVTVIKTAPTADVKFGMAQGRAPKTEIRVRRSEVAAVNEGDQVVLDSIAYTILADPMTDDFGLEWVCEAALARTF
jgi:hypothetical protein